MDEAPSWKELHDRLGSKKNFLLLGIPLATDVAQVRKHIDPYGIEWPQLRDPGRQRMIDSFGVEYGPSVFLADGEGIIRFLNLRFMTLEAVVEKLLEENDPAYAGWKAKNVGEQSAFEQILFQFALERQKVLIPARKELEALGPEAFEKRYTEIMAETHRRTIDAFHRHLSQYPNSDFTSRIFTFFGHQHLQENEHAKAEAWFGKVVAANQSLPYGEDESAYYWLFRTLLAQGKVEEAKRIADRHHENFPDSPHWREHILDDLAR
ncbi:MAG: hypothetical protein ACYTHM_17355, partial [Planctomycetota bacterium]